MLTSFTILIYSQNPDSLVKFYTDALGCKVIKRIEFELDYGYKLQINNGDFQFWVLKHSEVVGISKDPYRHILNFYTDNVEEIFNIAKSFEGVKVVQEPHSMGYAIPGETRIVATVLDPDGNCIQFMNPTK